MRCRSPSVWPNGRSKPDGRCDAAFEAELEAAEQVFVGGRRLQHDGCRRFLAVVHEQVHGVALLRRSYALILGLWQMSAGRDADNTHCAVAESTPSPVYAWNYPTELEVALRALWRGTVSAATPEVAP